MNFKITATIEMEINADNREEALQDFKEEMDDCSWQVNILSVKAEDE
jgi:hypothetical protein